MAQIQNTLLSMDNETYSLIVEQLSCLVQDSFSNLNILDEVTNSILIRVIKMPLHDGDIRSTVNALYPRVIEELFAGYHNTAYRYCLKRSKQADLSNDIAQETIYLLLTSKKLINQVEFWVRKVAHNLLCEHYRNLMDESRLYQELVNEASLINQITSNADEFSFSGHEKLIPESVLRGSNYASYLKLKQFDNLGDYAKAKHISYEAAKSVSKKTIRNLKAEILLALGWQASPDILDYRQYKSIQSFIRKLLAAINGTGKGLADLRKLHPALPEALEGYKSVDDWGITMLGGRRFRLYLMHLGMEPFPLMSTVIITINNRNHVQVESCKRNQHAGTHNIPANVLIPKEKGRALWPYDRIVSLLNEKNR